MENTFWCHNTGDSVPRNPPGLRHEGMREGLRRVRMHFNFYNTFAVGFVNLNAVGGGPWGAQPPKKLKRLMLSK